MQPNRTAITSDTHPELFDKEGNRKFLTPTEREEFLEYADEARPDIRTFCMVLAYTGCHPSEATAATVDCFDIPGHAISFPNIYKRSANTLRFVPVPPFLMDTLDTVHGLRELQQGTGGGCDLRPWPMHRVTYWSHVRRVMCAAGIEGPQATPRGLRHSFALDAISSGVPLNTLHFWLGNTDLKLSTAIYAPTP